MINLKIIVSWRCKIFYVVSSLLGFLTVGVFAVWWFDLAHVPRNFGGIFAIADFLLFILVSYVIWHPIIMELLLWAIASHIKDTPPAEAQPGLRVAFLTTFVPSSESIDLLHKTLPAMVAAGYQHDTWLLDEGNNPEVKKLCAQFGVNHYSRSGKPHYNTASGKFAAKTKGGNHNSWYDMFGKHYDVVAQIDTDFVPRHDFLTKTLGYFADPTVAFVGTPQIYGNMDSFIARGAAEQTYSFYGPFLRGLHGMDSTLLIGANHVIRVAALRSVNHYSAHITEDMLTGMKLHAKGWKSVYVHEPLAVGEGPSTWKSYFTQQMRWAYGCIDILFHHSPRLFKDMSRRRALYYLILQQHYFSGLAMVLGLIGLLLYFLWGIDTAHLRVEDFLIHYVPAISVCGLMSLWLQRFNVRPKKEKGLMVAGKIISMGAWPIFFVALLCVLRQKHLTYKVTPKGKNYIPKNDLRVFKPHVAIGLVSIFGLAAAVITGHKSWMMIFWSVNITLAMLLLPFAEDIQKAYRKVRRGFSAAVKSSKPYYYARLVFARASGSDR